MTIKIGYEREEFIRQLKARYGRVLNGENPQGPQLTAFAGTFIASADRMTDSLLKEAEELADLHGLY